MLIIISAPELIVSVVSKMIVQLIGRLCVASLGNYTIYCFSQVQVGISKDLIALNEFVSDNKVKSFFVQDALEG